MKRILATAGIAGLALIGVAAPANAGDNNKVSICHATGCDDDWKDGGWKHDDRKDGGWKDGGWKDVGWKHDDRNHGGWKDHDWKDDDCKDHEVPPVEVPPVEVPPVVTPPVVTPPVVVPPVVVPPVVAPPVVAPPVVAPPVVAPPVVAPPAVTPPAVVVVPAGAAAAPVVNRGFNAQTAAGTQPDSGMPAWFGGLAALLGATGLVALRHRGRLQDFQASK